MNAEQIDIVYVIRHKESGKLVKFGSKCGWMSTGAAKNAFNLHMHPKYVKEWYLESSGGLFDRQADYVIEEVK